jgi:hypothetical protein
MIHTEKTVRTLQAVALSVGLALFLWSTGLPTLFHFAEAAAISNASDTLVSSAPSASTNHTIVFTLPNGATASSSIALTFDALFTIGGLVEDDVDIDVGGVASGTISGGPDATNWGVSWSGNVLTLVTPTGATGVVASSTEITVRIGSNAVDSGTGSGQITNPSATSSYPIDIDGGASDPIQDSGQVRVAIIDEVIVSASIDTSLTFSVAGVVDGATVNTSPTTTVATTTPTTLPFGTLTVDSSDTLAHDLTVGTNALNGYSVAVALSGPLESTLSGVIDSFVDGADTAIPAPWQSPGGTLADDKTWGHWGVTSDDLVAGRANEFGADQWAGLATSSPTIVMGHTGPADESTAGIGTARVGYQAEISALQEAGDDYSTTLRYIVTPLF